MVQKYCVSLIMVITLCISPVLRAQQGPSAGGWFGSYNLPSFQRILDTSQYLFKWIKENPKKAGIGALAIVGTGYLLYQYRPSFLRSNNFFTQKDIKEIDVLARELAEEIVIGEVEELVESDSIEIQYEKILLKDGQKIRLLVLSTFVGVSKGVTSVQFDMYLNNKNFFNGSDDNKVILEKGNLKENRQKVKSVIKNALISHGENIKNIKNVLDGIENSKEQTGNINFTITYNDKNITQEADFTKTNKKNMINIHFKQIEEEEEESIAFVIRSEEDKLNAALKIIKAMSQSQFSSTSTPGGEENIGEFFSDKDIYNFFEEKNIGSLVDDLVREILNKKKKIEKRINKENEITVSAIYSHDKENKYVNFDIYLNNIVFFASDRLKIQKENVKNVIKKVFIDLGKNIKNVREKLNSIEKIYTKEGHGDVVFTVTYKDKEVRKEGKFIKSYGVFKIVKIVDDKGLDIVNYDKNNESERFDAIIKIIAEVTIQ